MSCIEEVDLGLGDGTLPFVLIVEATLSDELKRHEVVLSRLDTLVDLEIDSIYNPFTPNSNLDINRDLIKYESGAQVLISDDFGIEYNFIEGSPGRYLSANEFSADFDKSYQIKITTEEGRKYNSKPVQIQGVSEIQNLYAKKTVSDAGVEGIGIFIDNVPVQGKANSFRFNYEETFKIIAPFWSPQEFELTNYQSCAPNNGILAIYDLDIIPRQQEERTCYRTDVSNSIIQNSLNTDQNGELKGNMVRFISSKNFIISHRYSILVEQKVVSPDSYSFFEQLDNFSSTGNIFSQIQPGFLEGNIAAFDGGLGSVIGFFDVVSVSKKRLYFNYTDFYSNEALPPFPYNCELLTTRETHISYCYVPPPPGDIADPCPQSVVERIDQDLIAYYDDNSNGIIGGPICTSDHIFVVKPCGDCTAIGSNVVPEFWIE